MSDMRSLIAAQARAAAVAGERGEKPHLLMDGDQNIGNQLQILTPIAPGAPLVIPYTTVPNNPDRILNLNASSVNGQQVTVFIGASGLPRNFNDPGPFDPASLITGIIEFGNGSRFSSFEFDIPIGPTNFPTIGNPNPSNPKTGGVLISLPAGTLRVYARSDASLVSLPGSGVLPGNTAVPSRLAPPNSPDGQSAPVLVTAFVGYYTRTAIFAPTKTMWLGTVKDPAGVSFNGNVYPIPALASTIRILRNPLATLAIDVLITDANFNILDRIAVAAGTRFPTTPLPGNAAYFEFSGTTTTPFPLNSSLQALFELNV